MSLIAGGVWALAVVLFLSLLWYCANNTFQGKLFYYRLIKVHSISGKTSASPDGWSKAENTLGGDFMKFIPAMDRAEFENSKEYLKKAGDLGRTPRPLWLIAVIGVLIIAEGLGFSYLLGTFIAPEGTADTYTVMMVALVLVLCVVLGVITDAAGHQLYRTRLINAARRDWQEIRSYEQPFSTVEVSLHQDQSCDDGDARCTQLANRVGTRGQYTMVIIAVLTIIVIAFFSTTMRMKGHEKAMADQTRGKQAVISATATNPFAEKSADGLPAAVTSSNDKANEKAAKDVAEADIDQALSAFIILAVIFVITQIVAIYSGFNWGFAGKESGTAYRRTGGFAGWTQVREVRDTFIEPVEELMTALHTKFSEGNRKIPVHSFKQYIAKTSSETNTGNPAPERLPRPSADGPAYNVRADLPESLQAHLDTIDAFSVKAHKEDYVLMLAPVIRTQIIEAIKLRNLRQTDAIKEVEGLF